MTQCCKDLLGSPKWYPRPEDVWQKLIAFSSMPAYFANHYQAEAKSAISKYLIEVRNGIGQRSKPTGTWGQLDHQEFRDVLSVRLQCGCNSHLHVRMETI